MTQPVSPKVRRMQRLSLLLLVITGAINYLDRQTLAIGNTTIAKELGLDAAQMGVLLGAFSLSYAFSQLPTGGLVDKIGPRKLLGIGLAVWSVAQGFAGFVTGYTQFFYARIVLGIGEAPQFPTGARVVSNWFNVRDRGLPTGIFNSASTLGPAIAPGLLTWLMLTWGWRAMFVAMGVLGVIAAIVWYALYRDPGETDISAEDHAAISEGEPPRTAGVSFAQWLRLFRFRTTWGMILGFFGTVYLIWLYLTWLPGYLEIARHMSLKSTGFYATLPYVFGFVGSIVGGAISDKLAARGHTPMMSRKIPIICGLFGMALFTIPAAFTDSWQLALTFICLAVFCGNVSSACSWALVTAAAPPTYVASIGSIQNFGGYLGGTLAPIVTGIIVKQTGSFVPALVLGAAVAATSALIYTFVVKRPISGADLEALT